MTVELVVPREAGGERLDRFVAEHASVGSRAAAARLIDAGAVVVDGEVRPRAHRVAAGAVVVLTVPEPVQAPLPDEDVEVVHADERLLVVVKPAGLLVHGVPGHGGPTLAAALAGRAGGGPPGRAGIVHRLDRDTSGVLIVAKKRGALTGLHAQLRDGAIDKRYDVLVRGKWRDALRRIELPLTSYVTGEGERRVRVDPAGRLARTIVRSAKVWPKAEPAQALLEAELETGRTHQIRVHLAHIGFPLAGDDKYGDFTWNKALAREGLKRMFLHARRICFAHPVDGREVTVEAPLAPELASYVARLDALAGA